jgi:hypothetical protein
MVTWKFPISINLGDIWQYIGCGGQGEGQRSQAIILLPYWVFNSEGVEPPKSRDFIINHLSTRKPLIKAMS